MMWAKGKSHLLARLAVGEFPHVADRLIDRGQIIPPVFLKGPDTDRTAFEGLNQTPLKLIGDCVRHKGAKVSRLGSLSILIDNDFSRHFGVPFMPPAGVALGDTPLAQRKWLRLTRYIGQIEGN